MRTDASDSSRAGSAAGRPVSRFPVIYAAIYVAVAAAVHFAWFPVGDLGVETDFYGDLGVAARRLWHGAFSVWNYPFKGPVDSLVMQPVYAVVSLFRGDWYQSAVVLNLLCAFAGLILTWRVFARFAPARVAAVATVGLSLVFEFFVQAHKASSDLLFFVLFWAAGSLLIASGGRARLAAGAGAVAGLAFLTRYNGLALLPAGLLVLAWADPANRRRRRLAAAAGFAAAFLAVAAPWYALNFAETGRPLATRNLQNIFVEEFSGAPAPAGAVAPDAPPAPTTLGALVRRSPGRFLAHYAGNVPRHLERDAASLLGWPVAILALGGLIALARRRPGRSETALLVVSGVYFLAMCLVYHQPRFSLPLLPAYFLLAARGLWAGVDGLVRLSPRARVAVALGVCALVAALSVRSLVDGERWYYARRPLALKTAGLALRADPGLAGPGGVMAAKPHVAFYADRDWVRYPVDLGDRARFLATAGDDGAALIVVGDVERAIYPGAGFLDRISAPAVPRVLEVDDVAVYRLDRDRPPLDYEEPQTADLLRRRAAAGADPLALARLDAEIARRRLADLQYDDARTRLEDAIAEAARAAPPADDRDRAWRASLPLNLSLVCLKQGDHAAGIAALRDRLPALRALSDEGPLKDIAARALTLLGRHEAALGDTASAARDWREARRRYAALGDGDRAAGLDALIAGLGDRSEDGAQAGN